MKQESEPDPSKITKRVTLFKTFKTAGSTLMSIIFRLSYYHGLWPSYVPQRQMSALNLLKKSREKQLFFDSSQLHLSFSESTQELVDSVIPNSQHITILRDPVRRFISSYYYDMRTKNRTVNDLEEYIERKIKEEKRPENGPNLFSSSVFNGLSFQLTDRIDSQYMITLEFNKTLELLLNLHPDEYVFNSIDRKPLRHVLLTENFDEGLVMMMRDFHWSFYDIVYLKMKESQKYDLPSANYMEILRERHQLDYLLFDAAVQSFDRKLMSQPPDYWEDLRTFKAFNHIMHEYCRISLPVGLNRPSPLQGFCFEISLDHREWIRAHRVLGF